jgi:[phosphatase 2A protein]-leucine-carboxy methyltransferase
MSAPQIPNLNMLRRGGGGGGRGRLHSHGVESLNERQRAYGTSFATKDKIIQGTDNDASISRLSAVELGYLVDPFARALAPGDALMTRRLPIINRGNLCSWHATCILGQIPVCAPTSCPKEGGIMPI